jgi:acyl-CoA reductase-like NAD-dependent aldehyde dehydrogenase
MPSWHAELRFLAPDAPVGGERFAGQGSEDDENPIDDENAASSTDESRRIVEEAIRRLEEAEHEWSRSWEPDKPTE